MLKITDNTRLTFIYPEANCTSLGSNTGHPYSFVCMSGNCQPFYFFFYYSFWFVNTSKLNRWLPHANRSAIASLLSPRTITPHHDALWIMEKKKKILHLDHVGYSTHFHHTSGGAGWGGGVGGKQQGHWERCELWGNPIGENEQPPAKALRHKGRRKLSDYSLIIAQRPMIQGAGDLLLTEGNDIMQSPPLT